ncbi:MAG TPA: crossover junction endodeoxyribonuclease RuvC, partial [Candidatus Wirthbacteria bacterium]|nr:crossover junction endodeoxyribonuclease RuvC [Candidatus Wirthbacteria bacterium]
MPKTILGIDPGLAACGFGLVSSSAGQLGSIEYGCLATKKQDGTLAERISCLNSGIGDLIKKYQPDCLAVEDIYFAKNVRSALDVAKVCGSFIAVGRQYDLETFFYTPL